MKDLNIYDEIKRGKINTLILQVDENDKFTEESQKIIEYLRKTK